MSAARTEGACLCGAVRFSVAPPSKLCGHCHCSMCRRNHGAGFVTWFTVPRTQLRIEQGEGGLERFRSSDHAARFFCARCGSSLFFETDTRPDDVDIVLANMEGPIDLAPQFHIHFDDRAEWISIPEDGLPRLGGASGLEPIKAKSD